MASRTASTLPAPPVFKRELVEVAAGRGRKAAAELEAAARANAEAAEEARRVALAQRRALEEIALQRAETEKQLATLRREMLEERSEHERLVAQARFRATQEERRRLDTPVEAPAGTTESTASNRTIPSPELRTLQTQLAEREQLGETHRQRMLETLRERDSARLELQRVSDARMHAERRLERVTEVLHRATSAGGPRPVGGDGVEEQHVRALRDELAVAIARAKTAESRTNELRDEIEAVKNQRVSTSETLEATRTDLDFARDELSALHARLLGFEAEQRTRGSESESILVAEAHSRDIEREAVEARSRAVVAEQRVAELTAALATNSGRIDETDSLVGDLKVAAAEARDQLRTADDRVAALEVRSARLEADCKLATAAQAEAEARLQATKGELSEVDGARFELDTYVDELRSAVARSEARVAELEGQLERAVLDHDRSSVDLEATYAATSAELTSASARAEHLANEIETREQRIIQLESALGATTSELGSAIDRAAASDADLIRRAAEIDDLHAKIEALGTSLTIGADESSAAIARTEELAVAVETAEALGAELRDALGTARAERDVAVAQADSLTLELGQLQTQMADAESRIAFMDERVLASDTEHQDAVARLDDLIRELMNTRDARDELREREADLGLRYESVTAELAQVRARADELETNRSDDRRATQKAIDSFKSKADAAAAHVVAAEDQLVVTRNRHTAELERMAGELEATRARLDEVDVELAQRRHREDELRHLLADSEARTSVTTSAEPSGSAPAPVIAPGPAPDSTRPPSELRRAVFASLTELAG